MAVKKEDHWAEKWDFRSVARMGDPSVAMLAQKRAASMDSCLVGLTAALWELPTVAWMAMKSAESLA